MKHPVTKIRKRRKKEVVESFGGECQICGYNKNINALCFHHTDPSIKENSPTTIINQWSVNKSIEQLSKEKVILVCLNCHAEIHSEDYNFENHIKTYDILKKKCPICDKYFFTLNDPNKEQKVCSHECSSIIRRKIKERPTKDELMLLLEKYSYVRVGKMFNVSDNTIRKWLK
jgi:hypothetical protein